MSRSWSNEQWQVNSRKCSILDTNELEKLEKKLGIPMPEMVFGNNVLEVIHKSSKWTLRFDPVEALDLVDKSYNKKTKILQVAHSDTWKASKIKHKLETPTAPGQIDYDVNRVHKPFDWTYTTNYQGSITPYNAAPTEEGIPYNELKKPEPILFFDEIQLYEDELGDFGLTTYTVKIRVMPKCIYILSRLYMRVDNVAFRMRDTRIYIDLETNAVTREYSEKESSFDFVKSKVPIYAEDLTHLLRDPNWVGSIAELRLFEITKIRIDS